MSGYTPIIIATLLGFFALAALLLGPVYFFLKREERVSERWTKEMLDKRRRQREVPTNGSERPNGAEHATDR